MGGSDDSDDEGGDDQAAALNNIVQPLRKQIKKQSSKVDKLSSLVKTLEEERQKAAEKNEELEKGLTEMRLVCSNMKTTLDANPWRFQGEQLEGSLRATEKRLSESLDEQRVQLNAHSQVFQATQSTVSQLSQTQASIQADQSDGARRQAEELRGLTARIDHMRGEFAERASHTFAEATTHADRLGQRLQEDLHRIDQEVSLRATSRSVADGQAALQSELQELRSTNEELRREVKSQASQISELKDLQSGFALKSSVGHTHKHTARAAACESLPFLSRRLHPRASRSRPLSPLCSSPARPPPPSSA